MKSIRCILSLALILLLMAPLVPASAAYGVLFIPQSVYELELPTLTTTGIGMERLDFDPFLGGMEGARSWVHWDTSTILTECGGLMDLSYVCAVESEYPEGNYIVRCVAFYRNDAEKSLVSYHITYQTDETEFYVISYFGHHYRERMKSVKNRIVLTSSDKARMTRQGLDPKSDEDCNKYLQDKIDKLYYEDHEPLYQLNPDTKNYDEIKNEEDLKNSKIVKYRDAYFTPTPDTIYAGVYMNGDILLRNGSGKFLGTASWFEWDEDSGKVTMSNLEGLRRLYSFPSPRVRVRSEALDAGTGEEDFYDVVPDDGTERADEDAVDVVGGDDTAINYTNLVFFQNKWTEAFVQGYSSAAELALDPETRTLLAALMTVEFTEQEPELNIDTEHPIFTAVMDDMAVVAFDTDRGYVQLFLQLDPLATCYGFIETHSGDYVQVDLESSCDQVWILPESDYYDALISLASQLAE